MHVVPVPQAGVREGVGRPHPRSTVEAALEAVLARQEWAYGRVWNGTYQPTLVRSPIRPDLLWPAERVVVELDGLEHCRPSNTTPIGSATCGCNWMATPFSGSPMRG